MQYFFIAIMFLGFLHRNYAKEKPVQLKVLSYNIHYGVGMDSKKDLKRIADVINRLNPDIVGLQEVADSSMTSTISQLTGMLGVFGASTEIEPPNLYYLLDAFILSGLVYLSEISGDKTYLNHADGIALAALKNMVNDEGILFEINCEPDDCNADAEQFKGIFMRHLALLNQYSPKKEYSEFIAINAQSIWETAMQNGTVTPGVSWNIFSEKSNAATASSALDALNAALND